MSEGLSRRDFFKTVGAGTIGAGLGVSAFDSMYQYADALTEQEKHELLMKGTVNFKGFMAKEITPNNEFYITTYSRIMQFRTPWITAKISGMLVQ